MWTMSRARLNWNQAYSSMDAVKVTKGATIMSVVVVVVERAAMQLTRSHPQFLRRLALTNTKQEEHPSL